VVALDFTPNAVHAPIYTAVREGDDRRHGVSIRIRTPGSQPDSLKLLASGRVDIGILDIHDLGLALQKHADVVGIAALVQRPLAALIAQPSIHRPRDLEGRPVGVSGLPSDPAFVKAIMAHDGGDAAKVSYVTIGFNAVSALLTRRVAAVPAFWNAEGVALKQRGKAVREFRVDDYGAPPYPEVVLVASRRTLQRKRRAIDSAVAAMGDGLRSVLAHPAPAARQIAQAGGSDVALVRAQLRAVAPITRSGLGLDRSVLERWARFDARIGILERPPDVDRAFDFTVVSR
jgi:NitT/TauT family transport system substrate-binding protein/putative hydroxymethylpyrimidine transport system substrate-binding protein